MTNRLKNEIKRKTAGILISEMLLLSAFPGLPSGTAQAYAGENMKENEASEMDLTYADEQGVSDAAFVVSDETLYVNLDCYGSVRKINVVKGVSSTKDMEYTDYGEYTDVINMSNDKEIKLGKDSVKLNLKGDGSKLYYEGKMDPEKIELPWSFEVGYRLNGLPVEAERLSGASGLIEINIKATPNEDCTEYMRNNMLLSCIIPVDDEKIYSVDAPGSQTQTVGDITGVMFTALPGEEKEFTARLGCDGYESVGVIFMIVPATMDSFDNIKDIKELKDTWRESGDMMYDDLDSALSVIESMRGEMTGLKESLGFLDSARATVNGNKDAVFEAGDDTIEALTKLSGATAELVPYISTGKSALEKFDENLDSVVITLSSMQKPLNNMFWGLDRVQDGADDISRDIENIKPYIEEFKEGNTELQEEIEELLSGIKEALDEVTELSSADMESLVDEYDLSDVVTDFCEENELSEEEFYEYLSGSAKKPPKRATQSMAKQTHGVRKSKEERDEEKEQRKKFRELEKILEKSAYSGGEDSGSGMAFMNIAEIMENIENIREIIDNVSAQKENIEKIASASEALVSSADTLLRGTGKAAGGGKMVARELINLTNDVRNFDAIVGMYYGDLQNSLTAVQEVLGDTSNVLNRTASSLAVIQNTLRTASDDLDAGLKKSIASSLGLIEKSFGLFDSVSGIRESGGLMKDTLDGELDKFEEENTFLNIDPEAKPESFTSDKNASPHSVQIIIRTDEISADDGEEVFDAEEAEEPVGILARIGNIFVKIWEAIKGIFE